jgi:hypothetical protein
LLVTANVVPISPILVTLMLAALRSSETLVLFRATLSNIPEDGIIHSHRSENLQSYKATVPVSEKLAFFQFVRIPDDGQNPHPSKNNYRMIVLTQEP